MFESDSIISIIIVVVLLLLVIGIIRTPLKIAFKLLLNTIGGFITLFLVNFIGGFFGLTLAFNWINAIIAGVFGLPGVAVLLILKWFGISA